MDSKNPPKKAVCSAFLPLLYLCGQGYGLDKLVVVLFGCAMLPDLSTVYATLEQLYRFAAWSMMVWSWVLAAPRVLWRSAQCTRMCMHGVCSEILT